VAEPMIDMFVCLALSKLVIVIYTQLRVRLLSTIVDSNRVVQIPGFCALLSLSFLFQSNRFLIDDRVRPQTAEEKELYKLLSDITQKPASHLSSSWREPSITIHNIEISGPKGEQNCEYCLFTKLISLVVRGNYHSRNSDSPTFSTYRPRPGS
jgi:hypothetical protein